jgi:cytochrome P450
MNATAKIDFSKITELGNGMLPLLNQVREQEGILWNDSLAGWLVTRHADVTDAFVGKLPLSNVRMEARTAGPDMDFFLQRYPLMSATLPFWIVNADPPLHTRLRRLMTKAFSRRVVEDLRPMAKRVIAETLDGITGRSEIEFMEEVARQITGHVIMNKFGLPEAVFPNLKRWSVAFNVGLGGVVQPSMEILDAVESSIGEMQVIFKAEIDRRRLAPTDDFLSLLVTAREGEDRLSEEEVLGICYLVIVAGHDTTMNTMTLGVHALAHDQAARDYLLNTPERIGESVAEIMRYIAMSTSFQRIAAEDFTWQGAEIKKGDVVWLMTAAANRDPAVFPNPETLDMTRTNNDRTTVFGGGIHHCIGHLLAKMQLVEFFPEFFKRFPNARVLDESMEFIPSISFRGLSALHMRL